MRRKRSLRLPVLPMSENDTLEFCWINMSIAGVSQVEGSAPKFGNMGSIVCIPTELLDLSNERH